MEIDWMIHLVANNKKCEVCGETEYRFKQYACNAHSHGMEKYNHKDFPIVPAQGNKQNYKQFVYERF